MEREEIEQPKEDNYLGPDLESYVEPIHHVFISELSGYTFADGLNAAIRQGWVEGAGEHDMLISLPSLLKWLDYQYLLLHEDEMPF